MQKKILSVRTYRIRGQNRRFIVRKFNGRILERRRYSKNFKLSDAAIKLKQDRTIIKGATAFVKTKVIEYNFSKKSRLPRGKKWSGFQSVVKYSDKTGRQLVVASSEQKYDVSHASKQMADIEADFNADSQIANYSDNYAYVESWKRGKIKERFYRVFRSIPGLKEF